MCYDLFMYQQQLQHDLKQVIKQLGFNPTDIVISIPNDPSHGDYTTNIALQLSKQNSEKKYQSSIEIANKIIDQLGLPSYLHRAEIAGPGFINFFLKEQSLIEGSLDPQLVEPVNKQFPQRILLEYADPNTHKLFHIGHLRTLIIGESLARLLEFQGDEVFRANYGSDIGPTVAKALWGIIQKIDEYHQVQNQNLSQKVNFLGQAYAYAHSQYETNDNAQAEIDNLTQKLYQRDPEIMELWEETKAWSLSYFESIFSKMGTEFDLRVNESEVDEAGLKVVKANLDKVFKQDQGAIIFPGEKYGLHNRVFITSKGTPTYEAKELGLVEKYQSIFPFDEAIILSDTQQSGFFQVVNKAIELIHPHLEGKKKHFSYGFVTLTSGKMSSRSGDVVTAESLIDQVEKEIKDKYPSQNQDPQTINKIALAAIKFYYLKFATSSNITFDIQNSISLQGDTGPYVLYTFARIRSLLDRASTLTLKTGQIAQLSIVLEPEERELLRQLEYFSFYTQSSATDLSPNKMTEYLLALAKSFNLLYETHPFIGSDKEQFRISLAKKTAEVIEQGMYLLGIEVVDRM